MNKVDKNRPVSSIKHEDKRAAIPDSAHQGEEQMAISGMPEQNEYDIFRHEFQRVLIAVWHQAGNYADGELDEEATHKKYLLVRQEGKRQVKREIDHYNLDMIIALGYRGRRRDRNFCALMRRGLHHQMIFPSDFLPDSVLKFHRRQAVKPVTTWRRDFRPMALGLYRSKAFVISEASMRW